MKKNVASQVVGAQLVSATDGSAFTGNVTCYVTGDGGTQTIGQATSPTGTCAHEGNGFHTYGPTQAETNFDHVAFTFIGTGAVPVSVQIYTTFPQTGDSFARIGAAGVGLSAIPWNAAWDAEVESEANDALLAQNLDHLVKSAVDTNFATTVHENSVIGQLATSSASPTVAFDRNTASLSVIASSSGASASDIAAAVWDRDATGHQTQGTFGQAIGDPGADANTIFKATVTDATGVTVGTDTATLLTRMGTPSDLGGGATLAGNLSDIESQTDDIGVAGAGLTEAGGTGDHLTALATAANLATVDTVVDAILVDTAEIGVAGAGLTEAGGTGDHLTAVPWNSAWDAEVESEVNDALVAQNLDHLVKVAVDTNFATTVHENSVVGHLATSTASPTEAFNRNAASLSVIATNSGASAGDIATAVWGSGTRSLTVIDEDSTTLDLDATIRSAVGLASANLDTQIGDLPTNAELSTALGTADDAVLTQVALVKAKTDSLNFTVAGVVDANVQRVNDVEIVGDGSGTPFNV